MSPRKPAKCLAHGILLVVLLPGLSAMAAEPRPETPPAPAAAPPSEKPAEPAPPPTETDKPPEKLPEEAPDGDAPDKPEQSATTPAKATSEEPADSQQEAAEPKADESPKETPDGGATGQPREEPPDFYETRKAENKAWKDSLIFGRYEPDIFSTPPATPEGKNKILFEIHPEYRARIISVNPLELSGVVAQDVLWGEQRLRVDASFSWSGIGSIFVQADFIDGVLFGDNGVFGMNPAVNSGLGIASKQPNLAGWGVDLMADGNPVAPDDYGPVLRGIEPVRINYAYGEVTLPFGVLRVGRMPTSDIGGITLNDGRSQRNRWGASWYHNSVDRILFATKISELYRMAVEDEYETDRSTDNGLFLGLIYDFLAMDEIWSSNDDLMQAGGQLLLKLKDFEFLGFHWKTLEFSATFTHRWEDRYNTAIYALPLRLVLEVESLWFSAEFTALLGSTREISGGFAAILNTEVVEQKIDAYGGRIQLGGRIGPVTLLAEWAYASGDPDPRPESAMNTFSWARDSNLGLLLFEHILAFQSARSAAVGIHNLKEEGAPSFPLTEVATDGRVQNVNALFPQIFVDPVPELRLKLGALFAWSAVPTVDPIRSILAYDGEEIGDDLQNFHGGKPGNYWGTEIDMGAEFRWKEYFLLALEAAVFLPGDGVEDENGDAVHSWLVELRFSFRL